MEKLFVNYSKSKEEFINSGVGYSDVNIGSRLTYLPWA